jgi:hypothetical protein
MNGGTIDAKYDKILTTDISAFDYLVSGLRAKVTRIRLQLLAIENELETNTEYITETCTAEKGEQCE